MRAENGVNPDLFVEVFIIHWRVVTSPLTNEQQPITRFFPVAVDLNHRAPLHLFPSPFGPVGLSLFADDRQEPRLANSTDDFRLVG